MGARENLWIVIDQTFGKPDIAKIFHGSGNSQTELPEAIKRNRNNRIQFWGSIVAIIVGLYMVFGRDVYRDYSYYAEIRQEEEMIRRGRSKS